MKSIIEKVKKRNGEIVSFEGNKIAKVIEKVFLSIMGDNFEKNNIENISKKVIERLEQKFSIQIPTVENVQNEVEEELMLNGYYRVARAYIIYRYEHTKNRQKKQEEVIQKFDKGTLLVIKRNGTKEPFNFEKLKKSLSHFIDDTVSCVDLDVVVSQLKLEIFDGMTTKEIERAILLVLRTLIEVDPEYSYFAARVLNMQTNKYILEEPINFEQVEKQLREKFKKNISRAVGDGRLDPRLLMFDLELLSNSLKFGRDKGHDYLSAQTLTDRYFNRNPETKYIYENTQMFFMRVAMGLALLETNRNERAIEFYHIMSQRLYVPSTPTLFHSGTNHPQMSSCYLTYVEDSLDHIFKSFADNAQLSKWSGGVGTDWTNLRGTGALIRGTGVESQGIVPFLKIANDTTVAINRSGRRRGATCAYLETWHYDIEDFLELRKNTGDDRRRTHDMNTANWIPDLFMKRVREDGDWSLFSPDETPDLHHMYGSEFEKQYNIYEKKGEEGKLKLYKKIKAKDLWKKMLIMLFETGHPWITWKDPSNIRSPQDHVGVVHSSNLCTEITLNSSADETAVCNLGSVNLELHIVDGKLDRELLQKTVQIGMRMLDNVIDLNFYPIIEAKNANMRHRAVGLGVMGFQHALYRLGIQFDSEDAITFADESMEMISYHAVLASSILAKERGAYSSFKGSKWDREIFPVDTLDELERERGVKIPVSRKSILDWTKVRESVKEFGMRNSNCMSVAPTATISNVSVTSPTIEPMYKNIYVKSNQAGDFIVVNRYLVEDLKKENLWDIEMLGKIKYLDGSISNIMEIPEHIRAKYKEVFEIDMHWLIKIAAHRGKWIDQSQSLNIFLTGTSGKELSEVYMHAWELGLKTTYYLRTLSASQVEKSTVKTQEFGSTHLRNASAKGHQKEKQRTPIKTLQSISTGEVKLCKVEDPECESCQ
jgi:ribonucleoside-diphosphate reductase alpha chain